MGLARNDPEVTRPDLIGVAGVARVGWAKSKGREQRAKAKIRGREREKREHSKASHVFWKENGLRKIFP